MQHRQAKQRIIQAIKPIQLQFRANESIHIDLLSVCCDVEKRRENSNASSTTHSIDVQLAVDFPLTILSILLEYSVCAYYTVVASVKLTDKNCDIVTCIRGRRMSAAAFLAVVTFPCTIFSESMS